MTTSTLVPAGDEFSGGKGLGLFGRGDQRRYSREIDRVKAEAAIAATEERASIALANLHEQGRGLIANTAMTELGALVALEQHLAEISPRAGTLAAGITNAVATGASMKLLRW